MLIKFIKWSVVSGGVLLPSLVLAAPLVGDVPVLNLLGRFKAVLDAIIPILNRFALLFFLWGVANYILNPGKAEDARNTMLYGLIGLFVMVSVWGLVRLLADSFGIDPAAKIPNIPRVDVYNSYNNPNNPTR